MATFWSSTPRSLSKFVLTRQTTTVCLCGRWKMPGSQDAGACRMLVPGRTAHAVPSDHSAFDGGLVT